MKPFDLYIRKKNTDMVPLKGSIFRATNPEKNSTLKLCIGLLLIFSMSLVTAPIIYSENLAMEEAIIQKINITGTLRYTSEKQLMESLEPLITPSILLTDLNLIRGRLEAISSIQKAKIRRHWPYRLDIHLIEQSPIARWGLTQLINNQGEIFPCPGNPSDWTHLPRLDGLPGNALEVIAIYRQIKEVLDQIDQDVVTVNMGRLRQLEITLNGGAQLFMNKENFLFGLRRFVSLMSLLDFEGRDIKRLDLRYTNGFALVLKEGASDTASKDFYTLQEISANG